MRKTRIERLHGVRQNAISVLLGISMFGALSAGLTAQPHRQENLKATPSFDYDRSLTFDLKTDSTRVSDGVLISDVNYAARTAERGRIQAYLVRPPGKGPFAGTLYFHWLGEPNGDRNEFLDEAVALAKHGSVALLIQGYFPWKVEPVDASTDRQRVIDETIEVRRALDLLLSQPGVDPKRVGYVGHDYGAMYGAILSGVEKRVRTFVLLAGMGTFSDWSLKYWSEPRKKGADAYRAGMDAIDPINYISRATPARFLFQFSNRDKYISKATAEALYVAASNPKQIAWYDADHALNIEAARTDRRVWLIRQLRLRK